LYTFDDNNKTNCLARCPQTYKVRTAFLDPATEIGIIELRTCVQSIITASPELIAQLGQDYTVYAYDYSEYETPLVGQGMLSWVLASASTTPMAPANQSRSMVTGRVCKNILGLFSDGVRETLEVKLRLVPVPTCLQSEYLASMEKYRDASHVASEAFDAGAWMTFLRANPTFSTGLQDGEGLSPRNTQFSHMDSGALPSVNGVGARASSSTNAGSRPMQNHPMLDSEVTDMEVQIARVETQARQADSVRPSSRTSNRDRQAPRQKTISRANSFQNTESTIVEEGPSRKRARTTKVDWQGPSPFAPSAESLRVAASTAASIRNHRLSTSHPTASEIAAGELGNRPPTPRPQPALPRKQLGTSKRTTSYPFDAMFNRSDNYVSPYSAQVGDSASTSPEKQDGSVGSTPADIPSSPPIPQRRSPVPSSPALPMLPRYHDSGFASGAPDEDLAVDDDEMRPLDEDDIEIASRYKMREDVAPSEISVMEETPGDPSLLPRTMMPRPQKPAPPRPKVRKPRKSASAAASSPRLPARRAPSSNSAHRKSFGQIGEAQLPNANQAISPLEGSVDHAIKRSASVMSDNLPALDLVAAEVVEHKPTEARQKSGSSLQRKKAIQDRLANSIAAGEMPPFCKNCGEISTPTWRKAFMRVETGSPDTLQVSENEDGILALETVTTDEGGRVTSYRIIRKMLAAEESDYEEVQLCNRKFRLPSRTIIRTDKHSSLRYMAFQEKKHATSREMCKVTSIGSTEIAAQTA